MVFLKHLALISIVSGGSAWAEPTVPVSVALAVEEAKVSRLSFTGTVTPRRQAKLSSRTAGLIQKLQVDAGALVQQGDLLMELDGDLARIGLERIRVEIERAEIVLAEARRMAEEARTLASKGGFPKSEAEGLDATARVSEVALAFLKVSEREQLDIISRHQLPAPFAGVIRSKLAEEGEWVETGDPVVELVELGSMRLDLQVAQEYFTRINTGAKITVRLDSRNDTELKAKIDVMVPVKDPASRTFLVRLQMDDPESLASPGVSATAIFSLLEEKPTVQIPRDGIVRLPDGTAKAWVVEGDGDSGTARSRVVKTGDSLGRFVRIIEGLKGGERIVVRGNEGLREGLAVTVTGTEPPEIPRSPEP
jgi:RND family efflux transporter MFP subunit